MRCWCLLMREQTARLIAADRRAIEFWKARGRPASRRTSSTVDVLALRQPSNGTVVTVGTMAKDETASKRSAEEIARARARARFTINLQRAFNDLLPKLKRAYGQPTDDAAKMLSQHAYALLAIAHFLTQVGPDYLAHEADQFTKLAQTLQDVPDGIRAPFLKPPIASRGDRTVVWLARAHVALAIETMRRGGYARGRTRNRDHATGRLRQKSAAKWAAKRHPGLKQLITESGVDIERSKSLEKAIINWCEDFSSHKIRNEAAARAYSVGLDKLKAWASNCNSDQMEGEADRLLQEAVALLI
jgi:hypothetical protein